MAIVRQTGDVQVVEVTGEITIGKSTLARPLDLHGKHIEDVGETLGRLVALDRPRIVVDVRRVSFIDSAGVGQLVAWKKRALEQGGDIKLLVGAGPVRRALSLLSLERVFEIHEDESEAVSSFDREPPHPGE